MTSLHPIQIVQPGQARTRKMRAPNFPLAGGLQPMGLYPYFFTPVLPGETLDGHSLKQTLVSSPLKSPLSGAWYEHWLFFVKITDIDPALSEMFIGAMTDKTGYASTVDRPRYFTKVGQIDWLYLATQRIMDAFFLNEGENPVLHPDGVWMLKRINSDAFESAVPDPAATSAEVGGDPEGVEISEQMAAYLRMTQMGMGFTSYADYLKTYGLSAPEAKRPQGEPELLAYRRHWTQPTNVVNPADGSASGAWYWRIEDSAEKPKRFLEPGFVIGYQAVRPKLLDAKLRSPAASSLWGFTDFIPSYTLDDPAAGLRKVAMNSQPFVTTTEATAAEVWYDHRDLLMHGEQFVNGANRFTYPTSSGRVWTASATQAQLRGEYVTNSDIAGWWATAAGSNVEYDGIAGVKIKGHLTDAT